MQRIIPFSSVLLPVIYHRPLGFMLFFVFFRERQIKAVNLFCSVPEALQKPLTQTRKLTVLVSVSPLLSVKWVKFADFRYIKKSESASICLYYYYSILLFLNHKLLFGFFATFINNIQGVDSLRLINSMVFATFGSVPLTGCDGAKIFASLFQ